MKHAKFLLVVASTLFISPAFSRDLSSNTLQPVIVTANPFLHSAQDLAQPVTELSGDNLLKKLQPTIGETLSQELGIRSTYFGPNASRPVIRGLGGDQIQILQNGVANLDASAASDDHAVGIDPLSIERIEVVRGPAALLYGSKAIGGVVNVIDNRIPSQPIAEKVTGVVDARYNSANNERAASALFEGGVENYAWHFNRFKRETDDIKIPGYARSKHLRGEEPLAENESEEKNRLNNSQSQSDGSTIGLSRFFDKGYFGVSFTNYDNNYGVLGHKHAHHEEHEEHGDEEHEEHDEHAAEQEPDVTIKMKQQRLDFAGEYREPASFIKNIKYKLGLSNYEHKEFEGSEIGTVFKNRGYDSRVEIVHEKFGGFEGAGGFQSSMSDFSALGAEAFLPSTTTHTNSGFILEEIPVGNVRFQLGGRFDYQTIKADESPVFGAAQSREDLTGSGSAGFVYHPITNYAVALSTSFTQRAPNAQELFANGAHVATSNYELGNKNLKVQQSQGIDLSLRKEYGAVTGEVNLFYNRFQNFITSMLTGEDDAESALPIYAYRNIGAEFYGAEAKAKFTAYDLNAHKLAFEIRGDYVEAKNTNTNEALPRISPARVGASAIYNYQKMGLRLDVDHTFAQNRTAQFERKTEGYTMLNAGADYKMNFASSNFMLYLKATNLLNEEARNHVSFLKEIAPMMGRSVMIGVRTAF